MNEDPRCCGSGTCIIDSEGSCWCGQQWDTEKQAHSKPSHDTTADQAAVVQQPDRSAVDNA